MHADQIALFDRNSVTMLILAKGLVRFVAGGLR